EQIKRFQGSAIVDSSVLDREDPTFDLPLLDDVHPNKVVSLKKSVLHQIIHLPLKEIVEKLHRRLSDPRFSRYHHHRLVLTGGGSQLEGMTALVSEVFGQPAVRKEVNNLHRPPLELLGADSAVAVGLLNRFVSSSNPPSGSLSYRDFVRDFRIGLPKWRQKKVSHNPSRVNP
ncbi:MAG: hypothetical protein ORO03_10255, partial [Alphaproteobacteria bacterium]|nr:hypothetical protein [Alphaproteobacteria bacterium]